MHLPVMRCLEMELLRKLLLMKQALDQRMHAERND
jgi:hypothetical protein